MKEKFRKIILFFFLLCFLTLGIKINYGNIAIISTFTLSIIYTILYKPKVNLKDTAFWLFNFWFFIYLLSAFFSNNQVNGFERLSLRLLYLLIPFPALVIFKLKLNFYKILRLFTFSMAALSLLLIIVNGFKYFNSGSGHINYFHDFTAPLHMHAVYFSILIMFAIVILFLKLKKPTVDFYLIFFILSVTLFFCASKIMIALFTLFLAYYFLIRQKNKTLKIVFIALFLLGSILMSQNPILKERFSEGLTFSNTNFDLKNRVFTYDEKQNISDLELRYLLNKVAFKHMVEDKKIWTGYGLGDQQDWFDYHLMRYNLAPHWFEGFNVHNQYMDIWLNLGFMGLVYFVFMLVFFVFSALKSKDEIWLIFILIFLVSFFFEVYLSRNKGIVIFTLWNMFFYSKNKYLSKPRLESLL